MRADCDRLLFHVAFLDSWSCTAAQAAEMQLKQSSRVQAAEMLRQICAVEPSEYAAQAARSDTAGVNHVGLFIADLADRWASRACVLYCAMNLVDSAAARSDIADVNHVGTFIADLADR